MSSPVDQAQTAAPRLSDAARRFLAEPRFGVVSSINPDGSPLQAVIWYAMDGDAIVFNSRLGRQWPTNILRDPHVSILVADAYAYVEVRGMVEIDCDPVRGLDVISALAHRYETSPEKTARQIEGFAREQRLTFVLRPERIFERLAD